MWHFGHRRGKPCSILWGSQLRLAGRSQEQAYIGGAFLSRLGLKNEILAALVVVLVAGSLGVGYLGGTYGRQNTTTTVSTTSTLFVPTTLTSTTTLPTTSTETVTYSTTITSTRYLVLNPKNESTSTLSANGIQLTLSLNATELGVGQRLQVAMSLRNTLAKSVSLQPTDDFRFYGLYVPFWGACTLNYPVEMVILKGTYNLLGLLTYGYTRGPTDPIPMCMEGTLVNQFTFLLQSDQGNLSGVYDVTNTNTNTGPYPMVVDLSTGGYWNMSNIALGPNTTFVFPVSTPLETFGGGPLNQPPSVPFTPGNYTVAVSDEWGQYAILHFAVVG